MMFLFSNQDWQEKVRQEIFDVIGTHTQPTLADRAKMPRTEATISEIQRLADISEDNY